MRVALVGGAGFIGHNLAVRLRESNHEVMVVDNLMWNNIVSNAMTSEHGFENTLYERFFRDRFMLLRNNGVILENVDARDENGLRNCFQRFVPDHIVHLSAISSALKARSVPGLTFDLQLVTLRNALEEARHFGAGLTFMSSSTVYGDFEGDEVTENVRPRPKGAYANMKYMGERLVRMYSDQYSLNTTIIRPSALYGERCVSGRVSQAFIEKALNGEPLSLDNGGMGKLDFTYIEDLVTGIILAMEQSEGTETYNITFGNARTIRTLANILSGAFELIGLTRAMPQVEFEQTPASSYAPIRGTLAVEKARHLLGFRPKWSLEEGYSKYVNWYVDQWHSAKGS